MPARLIDVHAHFLPSTLHDALAARSERPRIAAGTGGRAQIEYGPGSGHPLLPPMVDLDLRLREMHEAGIDFAVMSVNVPGVDWFDAADGVAIASDVNDEMAALARDRAGEMAAMACLPMQAPAQAAAELERAVALGLRGGMLYSNVAGALLDRPETDVVFEAAARLGVPLYLHPTHPIAPDAVDAYALLPAMGFLFDTAAATMRLILGGLYDRHPDLRFVLAHAGSVLPPLVNRIDIESSRLAGGLGALSDLPSRHVARLYTDTVCGSPPTLRMVTELLGPDRVMFGTDAPFWEDDVSVRTLADAGLDEESERAIRSGTAERLFGLRSN